MSAHLSRKPLTEQIADVLRQEIAQKYEPDDRFPGDTELADRFGVSAVTVRQAVFSLVREGLLVRQQGSGTFVTAAARPAQHVAIVSKTDAFHPSTSPFYRHLIRRIQVGLEASGRATRVYMGRSMPGQDDGPGAASDECCQELIAGITSRQISAVMILSDAPGWADAVRPLGVPVFAAEGNRPALDYASLIRQGIDELVRSDRRKIALLLWSDPARPSTYVDVFRSAMRDRGLDVHEEWIRSDQNPSMQGAGWEELREVWLANSETKPDGLLVLDDILMREGRHCHRGVADPRAAGPEDCHALERRLPHPLSVRRHVC